MAVSALVVAVLATSMPAYADDPDLPASGVTAPAEAVTDLAGDTVRPVGTLDGVNSYELWVRGVQDADCPNTPTTIVVYTLSSSDPSASFVRVGKFETDASGFGRFAHGQPIGKPIFALAAGKNNKCELVPRAQVLAGAPMTVVGCWKEQCLRQYPNEQFCLSGAVVKASNVLVKGRWQVDLMFSPSCQAVFLRATNPQGAKGGLGAAGVELNGVRKYKGGVLIPDGTVSLTNTLVNTSPGIRYRACLFEGYDEACGTEWTTP